MVLSVNLMQEFLREIDREGGKCLLLDDQCTKTGRLVAEVLRENHQDMRAPPVENPTCAAFKEYEDMPKTVPLHLTEDDVTWVASKLPEP